MDNKTQVSDGIIDTRRNYTRKVMKKIGSGVTGLALAALCVASPTKAQASDLTKDLTGNVNAQYQVLTGKEIDETTLELNAYLGRIIKQGDNYTIIAHLIRGRIKWDPKGREHPWNNYEEAAIGV